MTIALILACILGCGATSSIELGSGGADSDIPVLEGNDTADELPSSPEVVLGTPAMSPEGGAFVDQVEVALTVVDGTGDLQYCLADPDETDCTMRAYTTPVVVKASTILYAQVVQNGQLSAPIAHSFVELDSRLATFSSTVPVMVFWTTDNAPESTNDVAMGLTVIEPPDGGELSLLDTPADSGRARLHVRGSSSASFDKKAYDMELWEPELDEDRGVALLGLPKNGDWVLYAPYYFDDALVRNPLAYSLSNTIGRYAPRTRFVEVYVAERHRAVTSADYAGVYVLTEEVEVAPDRVAVTPMLPEDVADPEVTGGYLFKIDRTGEGESGFYAGSAGGEWNFEQSFVNVSPSEDELVRAQSTYLENTLDSIGDALASPDLTDPATGLRYDALLDVDSFIDHHILNVYLKNPDAFRLSGYYYKDRGGLVNAGPVWDFDRAAGSLDSRAILPTWWDDQNETTDCTAVFEFGWYAGLFDDPVFAARYWARFDELLQSDLSIGAVDSQIDTLLVGLDGPAARNTARWGGEDYATKVAQLKVWFRTRHDWMTECIAEYPDPRDCPG